MNTGRNPLGTSPIASTLLTVENLDVRFLLDEQNEFHAVKNVSFSVSTNSTVALVGESGSGKSVSAMAVIGLLPKESARVAPSSRIMFGETNLLALDAKARARLRGKDIGMIFQEPMTSLNPVFTIGDQIVEALRYHLRLSRGKARARAQALLAEVGIPEPGRRMHSYPHQLSGGQQQRVMIAIAISCEPKLLIADEPSTSLDVTIQKQILELLARLQQQHRMSVLFITHDLAVVGEIADHVVVMQNGEVCEVGTVEAIFERPQHPYTRALLACRPRMDVRPVRLPVVEDFLGGAGATTAKQSRPRLTQSQQIVLEARNVSKDFLIRDGAFRKLAVHAVNSVSFQLTKGNTLGVVGESGSGKSTLALTLMRLYEATSGEVLLDGKNILTLTADEFMAYKRRIQIVFQNPFASLNPRFTISQTLSEPMQIHRIGANDKERTELALELLHKVGLPKQSLSKYPHEFSGGQRQRIAIARCLTLRPDVLICDESVSALDVSIQAQVLNLLRDLQDEFGLSYIFISHDLAVVRYISDHVLVMHDGEIVESGSSDEIYLEPRHTYTRELLAAIPKGWPGAVARAARSGGLERYAG